MIDLWKYEIVSSRGVASEYKMAGVKRDTLEAFAKRCQPGAKLTDENGEEWLMRYIIEELDHKPTRIQRVTVTAREAHENS